MAHLSQDVLNRFAGLDSISPTQKVTTTHGGFPLPSFMPEDLDALSPSTETGRGNNDEKVSATSFETSASKVPLDFLSSFPFPAFVLQLPIPIPDGEAAPTSTVGIPFTRNALSGRAGNSSGRDQGKGPFEPVWTNERYETLSRNRDFLDMIDTQQLVGFSDWVSGVADFERKQRRESMKKDIERRSRQTPVAAPGNDRKSSTTRLRETLQAYEVGQRGSRDEDVDTLPKLDAIEENVSSGLEDDHHDLLDDIKEHVERDRQASLGSRSDEVEIEEELEVDSAFNIVFRAPLLQGGETGLTYTLMKTRVAMTPPDKTSSYFVIQAVPTPTPEGPLMESPTSNMPSRLGSYNHAQGRPTDTSSTATLINAHRNSFPFYGDRNASDASGFSPGPRPDGGRYKRKDTDVDEDETPSADYVDESFINSDVSGFFPMAPPIVMGGADLDQLTSGPRKPATDSTSVEYLLQNTDWSKTSLGPRKKWPESLRSMLSLVQALPLQATLWWGPELVLLYNEPYSRMLQTKHPSIFGMEGAKGYAEVWAGLGPVAKTVIAGTPAFKEDDLFLFETNDPEVPLLEYYHSWYWTPIFDTHFRRGTDNCDPRKFLGLFNFTRNTTRKVIAERRLRAMRELSDNLQAARNIEEYNSAILSSLGSEEIAKDVPFALLYHVGRDGEENDTLTAKATSITDEDRSTQGGRTAVLKLKLQLGGSLGVPKTHRSAVKETVIAIKKPTPKFGGLDPARTSSPTLSMISNLSTPGEEEGPKPVKAEAWPFKEALQSRKAVMVDDASGLVEGFELRSWDELPRKAILLPICNDSSSDIPSGVLIVGLNLRRTYDQDYIEWHHQLRLSVYSGLLQVKSVEAEAQRIEELRSLDEIKNNWISNVSHELRLPLTLISGPVDDLLSECQNNKRIKSLLTITKRNVNRLRRLVDQLMDFSRIEGGRFAIACRPMPIGSYTRDLANLFRNAIERTKLRYEVDCEDDNGRQCFIDPDMYEKIALNLIGNAFKYCSEGGIRVILRYTDASVVLQVSDTGVGIPRNQMHHIGERFFRVKTHSRSHEGTGIGLSLTKELIRLMGGSLELESWVAEETPDGQHGSIFTVILPLGFTHLPPSAIEEGITPDGKRNRAFAEGMVDEALQWDRENESSNENSSDSGGAQTRPSGSERSGSSLDPNTLFFDKSDIILVVDDSKDLRAYLTSILTPYVGKVIEAADGEIGLAKAREYKPSLIISDWNMPNMTGFELLQAVKSDEELKWTPVILLTARAGEGERVEGLLTGAEDYMTKPFQSRELVARVSLQVQLGKRRKILEEAFATRLEEVEKRREAAEMERKRQELLIDVTSHELRNPTSAIIQCSQMISEDIASLRESVQAAISAGQSIAATDELVKQLLADEEMCQNINSCGQSQSRIADDVLALAKINLDMMQFTYQSTDIRRRAKEVVAPFVLEAKARGIELVLDLDDNSLDAVPHVMTDPFRLGQVLVNLVSNAMRYSGDGPIKRVIVSLAMRSEPPTDMTCLPPSVSFPSKIQDGDHVYLYVSVTDSGPGLEPEDVQILFRRFSQATKNTNKAFGGSGLGLWISKQISTQMGGRIEVDSEYGKGCTFRFFVRVLASERDKAVQIATAQPVTPPILSPEPMTMKRKESVQAARQKDGSPCRVLVVEDNMINQTILLKQLRKRGVVAEAANHGQAALDRLRQVCSTSAMPSSELDKPFDVVLMDCEMPIMDGLTAIWHVREEERAGKLRRSHVIALTGNARQQQIEDALAAGMDSVLIKPYKIDEVMARINERVEAAKIEGQ